MIYLLEAISLKHDIVDIFIEIYCYLLVIFHIHVTVTRTGQDNIKTSLCIKHNNDSIEIVFRKRNERCRNNCTVNIPVQRQVSALAFNKVLDVKIHV